MSEGVRDCKKFGNHCSIAMQFAMYNVRLEAVRILHKCNRNILNSGQTGIYSP